MHDRLSLRLRVALFFAALAAGGIAALALGLWLGWRRAGGPADGFVIAGVVGALGVAGLAAWVALLFDEHVARPVEGLSAELKSRAHADIAGARLDTGPARYLGGFGPAAEATAAALAEARAAQAKAVEAETRRLRREKQLLEALLRDLAEGVIVATPDHRVMLYNQAAQELLGGLGLDRPLAAVLRPEPVQQALARLEARQARGEPGPESFLAASRDGARFLLGALAPFATDDAPGGHVLILRDATDDLRAHAERDHLFNALMEGVRRPASAIGAILEVLQSGGEIDAKTRSTFIAAEHEELDRLYACLRDLESRHDATAARHWPMARVAAGDILDGLRARGGGTVTAPEDAQFLRCDAFAIVELLSSLQARLAADDTRRQFTLAAERLGNEVWLNLGWDGPAVTDGTLQEWLGAPLSDAYGDYSGRDALTAHRSEIWTESADGWERLVLPLPAADAPARNAAAPRPEFYDFDLPDAAQAGEIAERPLSSLPFVVFDTETTGLSPRDGDRIVQIAGLRIVNGRLLSGERFETLVDPDRPIPAAATRVHRITDEMVAGAPDIAAAGRAFHEFCDGAVLVAHNAPFDLAFLRRDEAAIGRRFDQPALCTVLLSSALYGPAADHSLDGLAARLGIVIPDEARHSAMGDARATGEAFCHLIGLLEQAGICTLQQAIAAGERQTRIRRAQSY